MYQFYMMGHGSWTPTDEHVSLPPKCKINFYEEHPKALPTAWLPSILDGSRQPVEVRSGQHHIRNYLWQNGLPGRWNEWYKHLQKQHSINDRLKTWDMRYVQYYKTNHNIPIMSKLTLKDFFRLEQTGLFKQEVELHFLLCRVQRSIPKQ